MVRKIYRDISVKSFRCATQHRKIIIFISHKYLCDCLHQLVRPNREQYIDIDDKIRIEGSTIQNRLLGQPSFSFKIIHYFNYWSQLQKGPRTMIRGKIGRKSFHPHPERCCIYCIVYCMKVLGAVTSDHFLNTILFFISDFLLLLRLFKSKTILYH